MDDAIAVYESLCRPTSAADLERVTKRLRTHVDAVEEAALSRPELNLELAELLVAGLRALAADGAGVGAEQRAQVRGAIDYFLLTADADDDLTAPRGLEDDARVFNHVCRAIDRDDLVISMK